MPALSFDDIVTAPGPLAFDDIVPPVAPESGLIDSMGRGAMNRVVGTLQLAQDVGKSLYGANPHDQAESSLYQQAANILAQKGKGTGITGTIGEAIGDPLNYVPGMSLLKYGAAAGLTAPQTNDTGLGGRVAQAAITAPTTWLTGKAAGLAGKGIQAVANKTGLTDLIGGALQKFGLKGDPGDLYSLAQQAGLDVNGKTPQEIADSLNTWYQNQTKDLAGKVSGNDYNPVEGFKGIAQNWTAEQQAANQGYKTAIGAGEDLRQSVPGLGEKLDSLIGALDGNTLPGTSEHAALQQLKAIRDAVNPQTASTVETLRRGAPVTTAVPGETVAAANPYMMPTKDYTPTPAEGFSKVNFETAEPAPTPTSYQVTGRDFDPATGKPIAPKVDVPTLLNLRSNLNEGYSAKALPERGDASVNSITNDVRQALAKAGEANPEFGQALNYADARQANLGYTYKNNDLLKKFFKPEDLTALQQNATNGSPIPDITLKRANLLISSIKTPEDLATLTKAMPTEMADSLRAAKVQDLMNRAGFDYEKLTDPKFVALMKQSLGNDPEALNQLNTIQQIADVLKRRNINVASPEVIQKGNHEASNWVRAAWDLFEHRKQYAVRMAYRALTDEDKNGLLGLQKEIQQGAPFRNALPQTLQQIAPRLATPQMKQGPQEPEQPTLPQPDQPKEQPQAALPTSPIDKFAAAESGNNPNAHNPNSSATGNFQFTDSTWATMVKKYGKQTGITLQDKNNPAAQSEMARLYAVDNIKAMEPKIGRLPSIPELYLAHVFGADGASRLINAQGTGKQAMLLYPKATTSANRNLFFDHGRPRTVEELYSLLSSKVS